MEPNLRGRVEAFLDRLLTDEIFSNVMRGITTLKNEWMFESIDSFYLGVIFGLTTEYILRDYSDQGKDIEDWEKLSNETVSVLTRRLSEIRRQFELHINK
ncbi:MAG: hypothetical protein NWE89_12620 [Candidatus Bathyarchaeota archaeon]|nr:hypothetical protein [Candidatus Bathyarchaeota archaeon]